MYKLNMDELVSVEALDDDRSAEYIVFPNPFVDQITIQGKLSRGMTLEVYNTNGSLVYREPISVSNNLSSMKSGMYIINIQDDQGRLLHSQKVLKK